MYIYKSAVASSVLYAHAHMTKTCTDHPIKGLEGKRSWNVRIETKSCARVCTSKAREREGCGPVGAPL